MLLAGFTLGQWFLLVHHEFLLFCAAFFAVGVIDEFAVDISYFWMRARGRIATRRVNEQALLARPLRGRAAVFVPAWLEAAVIGPTIHHMLEVWRFKDLRIYVGCYLNDPATLASAMAAARGDPRVRIVVHGLEGPTSKADCLNRLYEALCEDEARGDPQTRMVVLHDAEDMVDPAALSLLDDALEDADFVQLPVVALPQSGSAMVAGHYSDEFSESHAKGLVVRDAIGAAIPGAGVGLAISRAMLTRFGAEPFAHQSLTEDYELGLRVAEAGGRGRFLRCRTDEGRLVATRAFFPARIDQAVRQKTRWMHGIALQGWDRLGWQGKAADIWMQLRDRRGPLAAILLSIAYLLIGLSIALFFMVQSGLVSPPAYSNTLQAILWLNFAGLLWRFAMRAAFTTREFGWREGLRSVPRLLVSNIIAIMAARRALAAYLGTLRGAPVIWDKTEHRDHPVLAQPREIAA